jgi:RNA polymerase sigma-54 factor
VQENPLLELREDWNAPVAENTFEHPESSDDVADFDSVPPEAAVSEVQAESEENFESDSEWPQENIFSHGTYEDDDHEAPQIPARPLSLREHLNFQICLSQISEREKNIISLLIDSLNEDGYLLQDLDELMEMLPAELGISLQDLQDALKYLQRLDPSGVGARNLQECLVLQLQALPDDAHRDQAIKVVQEYLEILASHDFAQIKRSLACDDQSLRAIQKLIVNLNPKPGAQFNSQNERYIVPDITVTKKNGIWGANLNMAAIPRLNINHLYANILKQEHHSSRGLVSQLNEAKWLIKNIQQRSRTILKVASAIVERQQQFFEHGEVAMRPLVLRDIAETLNLHESTVSRVTTQKFMYTPRGIFELKYFFGSHVSTDSGGACSATAIRALIKQLIQEENPRKPLSDNRISTILEQQGIVVARRTIAKYRESIQIPAANLRKSF